ncbi:hypothetical protein [Streptomyces sp. NPDC058657]|uniref:hypothetical protein n=1 Tax=unclassified Streptomyces TaxID=2593676 RepID=UPI0036480AE6
MTAPTSAPDLTTAQIALTLDSWDRPMVLLPDDMAARLSLSAKKGVKDYGYCHFESVRFDADTFETRAIRTIIEAVVAAHPDEAGLTQYHRWGTAYFYGTVVGVSGWNESTRSWADYQATKHLHVHGLHLNHDGRSHFGS